MDDTTQHIAAFHCTLSATSFDRYRAPLRDPLVRACPVEVPNILCQHAMQMRLIHDQQFVQALFANRPNPALGKGIGGGCAVGGAQYRDAFRGEHTIEARWKLVVVQEMEAVGS